MEKRQQILLLFSHQLELDACTEAIRARTHRTFRVERVGIGPTNARNRTAYLLDELDDPSCVVLSLGSAGWLQGRNYPGQPVWAKEIRGLSGPMLRPTLDIPPPRFDKLGWFSARLVSVSRPVMDGKLARELAESVGAEMVDMESRAILETCVERKVRCGVVRIITDLAQANAAARYRERVAAAMKVLGAGVAELVDWLREVDEKRRRDRAKR